MKTVKQNSKQNNSRVRLSIIVSLLLTLLLNFVRLFGHYYRREGPPHMREIFSRLRESIWLDTSLHFLFTFLTAMFIFYVFYRLIHKKLYVRIIVTVIASFLLSGIFLSLHVFILNLPELFFKMSGIYFFRTLLILATIYVTVLATQLAEQKQKAAEENQKLIAENLRTQFEVLKNQVNPHFLFNSLSTLTSLISHDNVHAQEYVHRLSDVLRYTLQKRDLLPLREELEFAESYCHLIRIRYGDSLILNFSVEEQYFDRNILPLGLQVLIENAIKHNVITRKQPLTISVFTTENASIVVENTIQPKIEVESGSGIGLANLNERYRLLAGKEITITNNNDVFRVEIPLLSEGD